MNIGSPIDLQLPRLKAAYVHREPRPLLCHPSNLLVDVLRLLCRSAVSIPEPFGLKSNLVSELYNR